MSKEKMINEISSSLDKYITNETGSYYVLKNPDYPPWKPYANNPEGRYNGPCTGSLYLGDSLDTCIKEVGTEHKVAYKVVLDEMNPVKILDLEQWCKDNPEYSSSLLIKSESGGWEPTREVGDLAYGKEFQGIRFLSQYGDGRVNLLLYRDQVPIHHKYFKSIKLEKEDDE